VSAFDGLRARLERLFADAPADRAGALREALVEMRTGVGEMKDALARTEGELAAERQHHDDAVRRRGLAESIGDTETVEVAERFVSRHSQRNDVLDRKLAVQRDELAMAERELEELTAQVRSTAAGRPDAMPESIARAWRDIEAAGGSRPGVDLESELLKAEAEKKLHQAAVEAQLAHLKRKLGREP
jgi:hypothetical protein